MKELFDDNIKQLCKEIKEIILLRFEKHDKPSYNSTIEKDKKTGQPIDALVWYYDPLSLPKLAHELYHIKIGLVLGDCEPMLPGQGNSMYSRLLLNDHFCEQFLNQIDHCIFYPLYKNQGYPEDEFFEIVDPVPYISKLDEIEKEGVKEKSGEYDLIRVADYMKLIALFLFFPIDSRFSHQVRRLKHIDATIFSFFKDFKKSITNLDIVPSNRQKLQETYESFLEKIDCWTLKHKFSSQPFDFSYL